MDVERILNITEEQERLLRFKYIDFEIVKRISLSIADSLEKRKASAYIEAIINGNVVFSLALPVLAGTMRSGLEERAILPLDTLRVRLGHTYPCRRMERLLKGVAWMPGIMDFQVDRSRFYWRVVYA